MTCYMQGSLIGMGAWNKLGQHQDGILETAHIRSCCIGNVNVKVPSEFFLYMWGMVQHS